MAKMTHTYKDFLRSAANTGLMNSFSAGDLMLAEADPDAGMTLLNYKQDYQNASTDEARALANAGMERLRALYNTGSTAGTMPKYENYVNQYSDERQSLIGTLQQGFDPQSAEALWADYRKAYLREGQRAYEDSLGAAAANTGGIASTAAVTAAQQARNYYAAQASDKRAELYQQAYENYLAGRAQAVSELGMYDQLDQSGAALHQQNFENIMAQTQMNNAQKQQAFENEMAMTQMENTQSQQAFENDLLLRELETQQSQQSFENAMNVWKSYGYVTPGIAETLGLPAGTVYTEQAYNTWYQAYQESANGVYTGKGLTDTVNTPAQTEETAKNPAAGDRPTNHGTVSRGSAGSDVTALQTYLIHLGYHCGDKGADGVFGTDTRAAVRAFQADHGLQVDGVCGKKTWAALFAAMNG